MDRETLDAIYKSIQGLLIPEAAVPGVPNLFGPYCFCAREYDRMRDAYERVCNRLGVDVDDEDKDLNIMVETMEAIQEVLCKEMFLLGMDYGKHML